MTRSRRAMAMVLLLTGLQFSLAGQSSACLPLGKTPPSVLSAAPTTPHDQHQGPQHHGGEHQRQHCLTSVICIQLPSPDTAVEPTFAIPVSGRERLATLTTPRSQSTEPTTPPPRG